MLQRGSPTPVWLHRGHRLVALVCNPPGRLDARSCDAADGRCQLIGVRLRRHGISIHDAVREDDRPIPGCMGVMEGYGHDDDERAYPPSLYLHLIGGVNRDRGH